jgi:hypothetical protein
MVHIYTDTLVSLNKGNASFHEQNREFVNRDSDWGTT